MEVVVVVVAVVVENVHDRRHFVYRKIDVGVVGETRLILERLLTRILSRPAQSHTSLTTVTWQSHYHVA